MSRPRVVTLNVASVDGRLTVAPGVNLMAGDERWTAMAAAIDDSYAWPRRTHDPDLLLEGRGSFMPSDAADAVVTEVTADAAIPQTARPPLGEHFLPPDVVSAPGRRWFAVVDGPGAVDLQFTEWPDPAWTGWHALVLTSLAAPAEHLGLLRQRGIPYLVVGERHVALGTALELVHDLLGVRTVVCSGGGRLGGALLREGLVDEIDVELLPWVIGGKGTPALFDADPLAPDEWPTRLELRSDEVLPDGRIRLRYEVVRA